jgi:hypothetical protein
MYEQKVVNYSAKEDWLAYEKTYRTYDEPNHEGWNEVHTCFSGGLKPKPSYFITEDDYEGLSYVEALDQIEKKYKGTEIEITSYNPYVREFPEIPYKEFDKNMEYNFVALEDRAIGVIRNQVAYNRGLQQAHLLKDYIRPKIIMKFSNLCPDIRERIEHKTNSCWEWIGNTNKNGYGTIRFNRKNWLAHRLTFTLLVNDIPKGAVILHACDNPPCVNPNHLFVGTPYDNLMDMHNKGRTGGIINLRKRNNQLN